MGGSTGLLDTTNNDKIGVDTNCGLTQTGPPSSNEGVNQGATLSGHDWMLSIQGPRSTEQVGEDTLNEVFGKDSVSPPFIITSQPTLDLVHTFWWHQFLILLTPKVYQRLKSNFVLI